jgi:phosphatidylinositol-3-phosphatase
MENHSYEQIVGDMTNDPYINQLAQAYGSATNMHAEAHPSLPNYIAMTSGSTQGITDDSGPSSHPLNVPNIFAQLSGGQSRSLEESMPSSCYKSDSGNYAVRHDPEVYYTNLGTDCGNYVVPFSAIPDLSAKFTFITPNLCHDSHSCGVGTGDRYLAGLVPKIVGSSQYRAGRTALFITYDENDGSKGNHIPTLVIAPQTRAGTRSATRFTHYSLLRTTEEMLGLKKLGAAAKARSMRAAFGL